MNEIPEAYWQSFLLWLDGEGGPPQKTVQAWSFSSNPQMANLLGRLVLQGVKTATASLACSYELAGESTPKVGDINVILDGHCNPLCVIRTTAVELKPFDEVDGVHAFLEGEGDRSLDYWRDFHWDFFVKECSELGVEPSESMLVVCERFELIYA